MNAVFELLSLLVGEAIKIVANAVVASKEDEAALTKRLQDAIGALRGERDATHAVMDERLKQLEDLLAGWQLVKDRGAL